MLNGICIIISILYNWIVTNLRVVLLFRFKTAVLCDLDGMYQFLGSSPYYLCTY